MRSRTSTTLADGGTAVWAGRPGRAPRDHLVAAGASDVPAPAEEVLGPRVLAVNVGAVRTVDWHGIEVTTGIWKAPVAGRVAVHGVNLEGDDQADRAVHGGPDKAVYAYASEDYEWWSTTRTGRLELATFGENLSTAGIDLNACLIGDRWQVGTALLEVAQPRTPCHKLGIRMGDDGFPARFALAGRPGAYLRIIVPGDVGAGDLISVDVAAPPAVRIGSLVGEEADVESLRTAALDPRVPRLWRAAASAALSS